MIFEKLDRYADVAHKEHPTCRVGPMGLHDIQRNPTGVRKRVRVRGGGSDAGRVDAAADRRFIGYLIYAHSDHHAFAGRGPAIFADVVVDADTHTGATA